MGGDTLQFLAEKLGNVKFRTNLLTVMACVIVAVIVDRRFQSWETKLDHMDAAYWHVEDEREFVHQVKEKSPNVWMPDPVDIIDARHRLQKQTQ